MQSVCLAALSCCRRCSSSGLSASSICSRVSMTIISSSGSSMVPSPPCPSDRPFLPSCNHIIESANCLQQMRCILTLQYWNGGCKCNSHGCNLLGSSVLHVSSLKSSRCPRLLLLGQDLPVGLIAHPVTAPAASPQQIQMAIHGWLLI